MNGSDFLKLKKITQTMLAKELNCTVANVSLWFSGTTSPKIESVENITKALNALGANTNYVEVFTVLQETRKEYKQRRA